MNYEQALENVYQVFSKYPLKDIQCCTCGCDRTANKKILMTTPLQQIDKDAISYYAFKATYTMGDLKDFKHFLPRIFEYLEEVETGLVLRKLDDNDFENWDIDEIKAVKDYLESWLIKMIREEYIATDFISGIANKIAIKPILNKWLTFSDSSSMLNLVYFIIEYYEDVCIKNRFDSFENNEFDLVLTLKSWLQSDKLQKRLEDFYFSNTEENKELEQDIEIAYHIISN